MNDRSAESPDGPSTDAAGAAALQALRQLGFAIAIVVDGRIDEADELIESILGWTRDELREMSNLAAVLAPEERYRIGEVYEQEMRGEFAETVVNTVIIQRDGSRVPVQRVVIPIESDPTTMRRVLMVRDRTDELDRELFLNQLVELWRAMPTAIFVWDASESMLPSDIRLCGANNAANTVVGFDLALKIGMQAGEIFSGRQWEAALSRAWIMRDSGRIEQFPDVVIRNDDGSSRVYKQTAIALGGGAIAVVLDDVTSERVEYEKRQQLMERIVELGDEERRSIAMGIHDDPIQQVAAASMLIDAIRRNPASNTADARLASIEGSLRSAMTSLRHLVFDLSPPELIESGLGAALRSAVNYLFADTTVDVAVVCDDAIDLSPHELVVAFRIALEAISNGRRHAQCSALAIAVEVTDTEIELVVRDNGVGFSPQPKPGHIGLRSMVERALSVGGSCAINSGEWGTEVRATLPIGVRNRTVLPPSVSIADRIAVPDSDAQLVHAQAQYASLEQSSSETMESLVLFQSRNIALVTILDALASWTTDGDDYLSTIAETFGSVIWDCCTIRLLSANAQTLIRRACWHSSAVQLEYLEMADPCDIDITGTTHTAIAFNTRAPVVLQADSAAWSRREGPGPPEGVVYPNSCVILPLSIREHAFGTITVVRDLTDRPFDSIGVAWLETLANHAATSLAVRGFTPTHLLA